MPNNYKNLVQMHKKESDSSERLLQIEKILTLKSLDIFSETPTNVLVEVSEILEELELEANSLIFNEGEIGQCMYVIFKGEVKIHKGGVVVAILKEKDLFGEMSLLDTEARSASATTITDTLLLKLDQEDLFELMDTRVEVAKGIIKMLSKRLRNAYEKVKSN